MHRIACRFHTTRGAAPGLNSSSSATGSGVVGGVVLLAADTGGRFLLDEDLPVGVITAVKPAAYTWPTGRLTPYQAASAKTS